MFYVLHMRKILVSAAGILALYTVLLCLRPADALPAGGETVVPAAQTILMIDPGHGGEDGGAVAEDGTAEAGINLAIALRLRELMTLLGRDTAMTREEDISIHSAGASTLREKKASDLKNRVALVNSSDGAVLLSIHQNSLPQAKSVHGAQAFFNEAAGAEPMAETIQNALNQAVNSGNPKAAKAVDSSVYLMKHIDCAGVLVECGFLSNPEELDLLRDPSHQKRLTAAIAAGFLQYDAGK